MTAREYEEKGIRFKSSKSRVEQATLLIELVVDLIRRVHFLHGEDGVKRLYGLCPWLASTVSDWRQAIQDPYWTMPIVWPEELLWHRVSPYDLV